MADGDLLKPGLGSKLPTLDWAKFTWEALKGVAAASAAVFAMYANSQSNANGALAIPSENVRRVNVKPTLNYLSVFYCASQ